MTLKQRCQAGEAKLEQVSNALLDPRPEILDYCETELQELIALLEGEPGDPVAGAVLSDKSELLQFHHRIRLLALQVQNAMNLCQGWIQLDLSLGYTGEGRPAVPLSEPGASYEI